MAVEAGDGGRSKRGFGDGKKPELFNYKLLCTTQTIAWDQANGVTPYVHVLSLSTVVYAISSTSFEEITSTE
ncbi:unnamed protein product [Penicillium camemberti]|uniref:Str. FM013 n=1 Tax=Penicillium camemberti (strain FM 013) TaxID=1429867 RepID=A0A0G4PQW2_PENC3|nr:unnamed protein product [Penicillium camemberti]